MDLFLFLLYSQTSMNVKMPPCTTAPFLLLESRVSIHLENSSARASQAILGMESRVMVRCYY